MAISVVTTTLSTKTVKQSRATATSITTSATYEDVTNLGSLTLIPNNYVVATAMSVNKNVAGTGTIRITDGVNTFAESEDFVSGSTKTRRLTGVQNSGGSATVKMQYKSSDANNFTVSGSSVASSFSTRMAAGRFLMTLPVVNQEFIFPVKVSIGTLDFTVVTTDESLANASTLMLGSLFDHNDITSPIKSVTVNNLITTGIPVSSTQISNEEMILFDYTGTQIEVVDA